MPVYNLGHGEVAITLSRVDIKAAAGERTAHEAEFHENVDDTPGVRTYSQLYGRAATKIDPQAIGYAGVDLHGVTGDLVIGFDAERQSAVILIWRKQTENFEPGEMEKVIRGLSSDHGAEPEIYDGGVMGWLDFESRTVIMEEGLSGQMDTLVIEVIH